MFGIHLCKVTSNNMEPRVPKNSYVLVMPWLKILPLKAGNIIKVNHPRYGRIIKSLAQIDSNGFLWLKGFHQSSIPIEQLGPVSKHQVLGKVLKIFPGN